MSGGGQGSSAASQPLLHRLFGTGSKLAPRFRFARSRMQLMHPHCDSPAQRPALTMWITRCSCRYASPRATSSAI